MNTDPIPGLSAAQLEIIADAMTEAIVTMEIRVAMMPHMEPKLALYKKTLEEVGALRVAIQEVTEA